MCSKNDVTPGETEAAQILNHSGQSPRVCERECSGLSWRAGWWCGTSWGLWGCVSLGAAAPAGLPSCRAKVIFGGAHSLPWDTPTDNCATVS